jgi:hypothetical protein
MGTAKPTEPTKVNCWDTFTFNNSTCTGIMMEQLNHSRKVNCWDTLLSTIQLVLGIMMEPQPVAPEKVNCWDILSTIQPVQDNDGTTQPVATSCWDTYFQQFQPVLGIMMEPPGFCSTRKKQTVGYFYFQQFYLYLG